MSSVTLVFTAPTGFTAQTRALLASLPGLRVQEKRRMLFWIDFTVCGDSLDVERARNRLREIEEESNDMRVW